MKIDSEISCPGCTHIVDKLSIRKFYSNSTAQEYCLYLCENCKLMFWEPRKIIQELYAQQDTGFGYAELHHGLREKLPFYSEPFFKRLPQKKGMLLDVGGGDGLFAHEAQKRGFDVYMIDFDEKSVAVAKRRGIYNAFATSLEDFVRYCQAKDIYFDVITFFEVIEHQDDLELFITSIKKLLKPNGWIAGSTPNRDRFFASITRKLDGQDTPPHHFFWWNEKSLKSIFNLHGFEIKVYSTNVDLEAATANLVDFILGRTVGKIKKRILCSNNIHSGLNKKGHRILKFLKTSRHLVLLPGGILLKFAYDISGGFSFYFQGKLKT